MTSKPSTDNIRWLLRRDMPEVLSVDQRAYRDTWREEDFLCVLRQRNCIGMVAMIGDRIAGFMVYELHDKQLEVLRFAVCPDYQRKGVGAALVFRLKDKLSQQRRLRIIAHVDEENLDGQLFCRATGFVATQIVTDDDGSLSYRMVYTLPVKQETQQNPWTNRISQFME